MQDLQNITGSIGSSLCDKITNQSSIKTDKF
jgi:hypothetical protein